MVKLRLRRTGAKKQPSYRLVASESTCAPKGKFIEILGHYNPRTEPPTIVFKEEKVIDWISKGAQPSLPVLRLLKKIGTWEKIKGK